MSTVPAPPVVALVTGIAEYHLRVVSGMAAALAQRDIPLLVVTNEPFASERTPSIVLDLIRHRVPRGVVALSDTSHFRRPELLGVLTDVGMPTVTLGTKLPGSPRIIADNVHGMRELMKHLLDERGVRRPALVRGIPRHVDSEQREQVFREELDLRGLAFDDELAVDGLFRPNSSFEAVRALLERRRDFDAIVALNDTSAFGALSAAVHHGLRVPDDLLLSGFDNTDGSRLSWPALTTVDQSLEDQGRRAVECVLRLAEGHDCPADVVVPSHLVVRASTTSDSAAVLAAAEPAQLAGLPGVLVVDDVPMLPLPDLVDRVGDLATTTRGLQERVALQDAALNLSWTTSNCRTMDDVITALDPCLSRLGVPRCFLAIDATADDARPPEAEHPSRLVLSYRHRHTEPAGGEVFSRHELLPPSLRSELDRGVLLLQALSIAGRERGFLLYEPVPQSYLSTEALRVDLPRTVDMVLSTQEMSDHAAVLERLVAERTRELERLNAELQSFVMRDGLTGIANRMAFQECLEDAWRAVGPGGEAGAPGGDAGSGDGVPGDVELAVMMIDVDMFKAFNDRYGHLAGDEALKSVASCLRRAMRDPADLACRYGGEEFAVVLRDTPQRQAVAVARRFQALLARTAIRHEASTVAPVVTASVGIVTAPISRTTSPTDLVAAADQALYQAKLQGRNRIGVAAGGRDLTRRTAV